MKKSNVIKKLKEIVKSYIFIFKEIKKVNSWLFFSLILSILATGSLSVFSQYIFKLIVSKLEFISISAFVDIKQLILLSMIYLFSFF